MNRGEKALQLLWIKCGIGEGEDEGLIDNCCDWRCNPSGLLSVTRPHSLDCLCTEQPGAQGWKKRPDVCLLEDEVMVTA